MATFASSLSALLREKVAAKAALQQRFKLSRRPDAFLGLAAARFTADDQKNWMALACLVEPLLLAAPCLQLIFAAEPDSAAGGVLFEHFHGIASRHPRRFAFLPAKVGNTRQEWFAALLGCDFFVAPSRFEPSNISVCDAMKCGTVPIGTDQGILGEPPLRNAVPSRGTKGNCLVSKWENARPIPSLNELAAVIRTGIAWYTQRPAMWARLRARALAAAPKVTWHGRAAAYEKMLTGK